jgi:P4 family phage/plasmid primase-like protien
LNKHASADAASDGNHSSNGNQHNGDTVPKNGAGVNHEKKKRESYNMAESPVFQGMEELAYTGPVNWHGKPCNARGRTIDPNKKPTKASEARDILDHLESLLPYGTVFIPIPKGRKGPTDEGWQQTTYAGSQEKDYQAQLRTCAKRGGNIGVLLGKPSQDLVAIDLDDDALVEPFLSLNPKLRQTLRTKGRKGCQIWVQIEDDEYPRCYKAWNRGAATGAMEWRCSGMTETKDDAGYQSVIFGEHPETKAPYQVLVEKRVIRIKYNELVWPEWMGDDVPHVYYAKLKAQREDQARKKSGETPEWVTKLGIKGDLATLDLIAMLEELGCEVTREKGNGYTGIQCPWSNEHSTRDGKFDAAVWHEGSWPSFNCFHAHCVGRKLQRVCEWAEEQQPGIVTKHCKEKFTGKGRKGSHGHWAPIEGETAKALLTEVGGIKCVGANWHINNGGIWKPTKRDQYREAAIRLLPDTWKTEAHGMCVIRRVEGESQIHEEQLCDAAKFDEDGNGSVLIAVQNGILKLPKGGEPEPLSPNSAYGFTAALKVDWNKDATCPTFTRVLEESLPDEQDRELLLDVLATSLIPASWWEAALVLQGEAGTGKSTVMAPITAIYGSACSSLSLADLCHPSGYKLAQLRNKLINLATELNTLEMDDTGLFKQLVSGEQFTAREIYGHPFEMCSTATLVFLANSLPRFKHGTDAEARRLRFVKFSNRVARPDVKLKDKVAMEAEGVFTLLVQRACSLLNGRKLADQGKYGQEVAKRFQVSNDPMGQFVAQCCKLGAKEWCRKEDLVAAFEVFREANAIPMGFDSNVFFRTLYDRFQGVRQQQRQAGGVRERVVVGISIVEPDGEPEEAETKSAAHEPEAYEPGSELPYEAPPQKEVKPEAPRRQTKADRAWARKVQRDEAEYARQMARKEPECPF